ncbi:Nuclease-related domain-containing protein [Bhargavaea ginsengi]|uniref:Nuclease-related domain-containing protein n=1 Tax=Bhargavaea ginsengi TaxID=426757 RepID=A0A1H6XI73_9BACL|nr:nuclease-related domain-containing protein [Bhargavaea ginsengi]SEJ24572.1 Nuclease-related domain-containing protein [Bhargavaea ginsengi]
MGKRSVPERLAALAVLESRVEPGHRSYSGIKSDLEMRLAGFAGEKKADFYLEEARVKEKPVVLKDVMIPSGIKHVQVDTLVLHPAFILVLEIKNMTGELHFDEETGQFYRVKNGVREGMRNPEDQLNRAVIATERFLASIDLPVKVHGAIVLASYNGLIVQGPVSRPIFPVDRLPGHVEKLEKENRAILRRSDLHYVDDTIKLLSREKQDQYFKWYNLTDIDIELGVRCPGCFKIGMERGHGKWSCTDCKTTSTDAHHATLEEYRLMYGEEITSKKMRDFIQVPNLYLANRLLRERFPTANKNKRNKRYQIKPDLSLLEPFINHLLYRK